MASRVSVRCSVGVLHERGDGDDVRRRHRRVRRGTRSWLSTRTLPTQLPGRAATTGRKKVWLPRGQTQSTRVVMTSAASGREVDLDLGG